MIRQAIFALFSVFFVITANAAQPIAIHAPLRVGAVTGKPFIYMVPATGEKPLRYSISGLPSGLKLDAKTGIITGSTRAEGRHRLKIMVANGMQTASKNIVLEVGRNAQALTPILGWNPWYVWGCNINDQKIRQAADLLVSSGLAAYGYNYINLDDCWQGKRDANGEMIPNERFPDMKALADYVHSKGLRIGIYTGPGKKTCAGYMASEGHIEQDVLTYSRWGMDLIKYDWCKAQPKEAAPYIEVYKEMTAILDRAPRAMVHMICQYGNGNVWEWGRKVGGHMWRTNHDLADHWDAVVRNGFDNLPLADYASPGAWNDLDMLMVGKGNWPVRLGSYTIPNAPPRPTKLTMDEQITHISLWSLMASPLIFSGDLAQLDATTMKLLTNVDMLAINQDALGIPGRRVSNVNNTQVVARPLADGSVAVGLFNLNTEAAMVRVSLEELGLPKGLRMKVRNVWTHKEQIMGQNALQAMVPAHGVALVIMTPMN